MTARRRRIEIAQRIAVALGAAVIMYYLVQYVGPILDQLPGQPVMMYQ